jgi:cytoskeletal protein RodZ
MTLDLGWQSMQSKVLIIIGVLIFTVTIAIAQEPTTSSPTKSDAEPTSSLIDELIKEGVSANSSTTKSDEEIAKEISAYESTKAQIFGDPNGKDLLPVDI